MRVRRGTSIVVACGLCALVGVLSAVALATPGHRSAPRHRRTHSAAACRRRARHRRCPADPKHKSGARAKSVKHSRGSASTGKGSGAIGGSTTPGTTGAAPGAPGATPASGATPPGLGGGTPPATESPGSPAAPAYVQVTAEDTEGFRFVLSRTSVPAGKVIIEFVNHGQDEHNLHAVEPADGSEAGSLPNTVPGAHPQLTLDLRPGSYTLFCSLPGHEAKGMKATLVVQ